MTGDPNDTEREPGEDSPRDETRGGNSAADDPFGDPYPESDRNDPFGDPYPESDREPTTTQRDSSPGRTTSHRDAVSDGSGADGEQDVSRGHGRETPGRPRSGPTGGSTQSPPQNRPSGHSTVERQHRDRSGDWTDQLRGGRGRRASGRGQSDHGTHPNRTRTADQTVDRNGRPQRHANDQSRPNVDRGSESGRQTAPGNGSSTVFSELRAIENSSPNHAVARPYLERIPDGYDAELSVMEWIRSLVETAGYDATLDALAYYESIGWISTGVKHTLEEHAATIAGSAAAGDHTLTLDDHRRSLRAIARIARSGT